MLRGPRENSARLWLRRSSIAALCCAIPAALSVWSIERRASAAWPWAYSIAVTGTGPDAPFRHRPDNTKPVAPGESIVWITEDRYQTGFPYPWSTRIAYLVEWNDPPPAGDAVLPDPARVDDFLFDLVLPGAIRFEVDPAEIEPGARRGRPIQGQRVLGGFDTVGAVADVSLLALGVSVLVWAGSVYALVRRRVVDALVVYMENAGLTVEQRRRRAVLKGVCPDCGYAVDHPAQARCPECGLDLGAVVRAAKE